MSWFGFGGSSSNGNNAEDSAAAASPSLSAEETADKLKATHEESKGSKESFSGFDPRGLERAAKAARELDESRHAAEALKLSFEQEKSAQLSSQSLIEDSRAKAKAFEAEKARIKGDEERKTLQARAEMNRQQAHYNDQLAKRRHQENLQAQAAMRNQELKRQEESAMRIEQLKRQTAQYEANLRKETEAVKVEQEIKGRILQERENHDLRLEKVKLEAREFRSTVLEGIKEATESLGEGVRDYLTDWNKLGNTVGALTLLAAGIYTAKVTTGVVGRIVEARLGKPPLIRDTSRRTALQRVTQPIQTARHYFAKRATNALDGVVIEPNLKRRLENIALSAYNTKKNSAPYRHMMLYGPPGTGKTMFAKNLANASGMDYAILTGGDVAPLGRDGVTEMHKLFDWANTSSKGVLIFVDEADAFLRKRTNNETMSEDLRNALNAFLYRTGEASKNFMICFATNQPEQLDWAVNDRTDEIVEFALPGREEREQMIRQYFNMYIEKAGESESSSMFSRAKSIAIADDVTDEYFAALSRRTEGFSGREISKLAIAWQAAAYGTVDCSIDMAMMNETLDYRVAQNAQKRKWRDEEIADAAVRRENSMPSSSSSSSE